MSNTIINTTTEIQYRLLLLLAALPEKEYSQRWLSCLDFIITYSKEFGLTEWNLHGNNRMMYTEYAARIWDVNNGIRMMAMHGWASVKASEGGFTYRITPNGRKFTSEFQTKYSQMYSKLAVLAMQTYEKYSEQQLDDLIRAKALSLPEVNT